MARKITAEDIQFSPDEQQQLVELLRDYLREELDQDLGRFEAEFLLEFMIKLLGPSIYNKGLTDARALLDKQMDDFTDALYAMEKPVTLK